MIHPDTIEQIKQAVRVEDVVGDFVRLKRRGANLIGLCPFHDERTPSFYVSPSKGIYKCFGCGAAGDGIRFIMDVEHFSYPEALKFLAGKYNIPVEEKEVTPEQREAFDLRESLFAVNDFAARFFTEHLWENPKGKAVGLSYLRSRGFTDDTLKIFGLGYALDGWDILKSAAKEAGYREDYLQMVGLLTSGEKKVDMYRDRIMFPIHNMSGRVVGFGGRFLVKKENSPKYINSPESEIYNKRKILYGLFQAKKAIIKEDRCLLVEGYTDVMALHQAGVQHVVSSSGTALTTEQIRLIRRLTPNVTILYDGDAAGIKASFRGIDMLLEEGMNVRVVLFPEGEDPDSFAKHRSPEEITDFLAQKEQDFIRFKVQILHKDIGNDPVARAGMIREMVRTVALVPDTLTRTLLIKECADITQMDEAVLTHELGKIRREQFKDKQKSSLPQDTPHEDVYSDSGFAKASPQTPDPATQPATFPEQAELAKLMIEFGATELQFPGEEKPTTVQAFIVEELHADELSFNQMPFTLVWNEAIRGMEENLPPFTQEHWLTHVQPELRSFAIGTLTSPYQLSENWEKKHGILAEPPEQILRNRVKRAVISFKLRHVTDLIQSLQHALKSLSEETAASQDVTSDNFSEKVTQEAAKQAREEQELKILEELQELDAVKKQFSVELSRVILT